MPHPTVKFLIFISLALLGLQLINSVQVLHLLMSWCMLTDRLIHEIC